MLKRLILCQLTILAVALASLPVSQAQMAPTRGFFIPISSYDNDPFVEDSVVERLNRWRFDPGEEGYPILSSNLVRIEDEPVVYREDPKTGDYIAFATNPWPAPAANADGDFTFPNEARFPRHEIERDADGKPVLDEQGLQLWKPRDLRRGMATAFEAANAVKEAGEFWAGRDLAWGNNGRLLINAHAFIDFNAFFSPSAGGLYFGVVPHRLPGEPSSAPVKMFEMATSWEIAAHEAGHALHAKLKPNRILNDPGYKTWSESLSDQMAMWASLRDEERLRKLLAETNDDLNQSNTLTRFGEAFAALVGEGTSMRDAFHNKKLSDVPDEQEVHARSEALTGAAYKFFLTIYGELKAELGAEEALRQAGQIMGFFLMRAADYTPENRMTLEDVAKAYLKVDKEFFASRYHATLVDEFTRREIFDAKSVSEWLAHEEATPTLWLHPRWPDHKVEQLIRANLDKLGIGPDFGLKLQGVARVNFLRRGIGPAQTIVRAQLTQGRGEGAKPLDNHGILVFRADGILADYHAPLPPGDPTSLLPDVFSQALMVISQASQLNLDKRGAALSLVRKPDGQLTVEARVMRGEGINAYMEVFTLDNPRGERREIVIPPMPPGKRIPIPDDVIN
ncbi:MAG: hypothetical protein ACREBD_13390 [Blastocatellia bacterium]